MAQLKVVYQGKGANFVGKAWRYGAMGGTWEEGPAEGQVIVSLQVQDHNYQPLINRGRGRPGTEAARSLKTSNYILPTFSCQSQNIHQTSLHFLVLFQNQMKCFC